MSQRLPSAEARRIVILTGARQTGKTTLAKALYPQLRYINFDAPENRDFARDLGDLARLTDLKPFRQLQRLAALRSGQLLSFSELARDAAISGIFKTILSNIFSPAHRQNLTSSAIKTPKIYWLDVGIMRQLQGYWGPASGRILETFVVSEARKWIQTSGTGLRSVETGLFKSQLKRGAFCDDKITTRNAKGLSVYDRARNYFSGCRILT